MSYVERSIPRRTTVAYGRFLRSRTETRISWSYRAYYNLACARAGQVRRLPQGAEEVANKHLDGALEALRQAFAGVYGRPRAELWRWASKDPSLDPLRRSQLTVGRFEKLLAEFAPPQPDKASSTGG